MKIKMELKRFSDLDLNKARWSIERSLNDSIQSRRGQKRAEQFLNQILRELERRKKENHQSKGDEQ